MVIQVFLEGNSELRVSERQLGCQKLRQQSRQPFSLNAVLFARPDGTKFPSRLGLGRGACKNAESPEKSADEVQSIRFTRSIRPK